MFVYFKSWQSAKNYGLKAFTETCLWILKVGKVAKNYWNLNIFHLMSVVYYIHHKRILVNERPHNVHRVDLGLQLHISFPSFCIVKCTCWLPVTNTDNGNTNANTHRLREEDDAILVMQLDGTIFYKPRLKQTNFWSRSNMKISCEYTLEVVLPVVYFWNKNVNRKYRFWYCFSEFRKYKFRY